MRRLTITLLFLALAISAPAHDDDAPVASSSRNLRLQLDGQEVTLKVEMLAQGPIETTTTTTSTIPPTQPPTVLVDRPPMNGYTRPGGGRKLVDRLTDEEVNLVMVGSYNTLGNTAVLIAPGLRTITEAMTGNPNGRCPGPTFRCGVRVFSSLPHAEDYFSVPRVFVHPRTDRHKTRAVKLSQGLRDRGFYLMEAVQDEPDRVDRRCSGYTSSGGCIEPRMPRVENTWFEDDSLSGPSADRWLNLWDDHYSSVLDVEGGSRHVIVEIVNEGDPSWWSEIDSNMVWKGLGERGITQVATSWTSERYEGAPLLWIHWHDNRWSLDDFFGEAKKYRDWTGNPVGLSTDGRGLNQISKTECFELGRRATEENFHVELMLANWGSRLDWGAWSESELEKVREFARGAGLR